MELQNKEIWLKVREAAEIMDMHKQNIQIALNKGKYITRKQTGRGGTHYQILLSSLPQAAQEKYYKLIINQDSLPGMNGTVIGTIGINQNVSTTPLPKETNNVSIAQNFNYSPQPQNLIIPQTSDIEVETDLYSRLPQWQRDYVDKYLPLIKESVGIKGKELRKLLISWAKEYSIKGLSYGNFMKMKKEYEEYGITGLIPGYGKNASKSIIDDSDYDFFKQLYLSESRPTLENCWKVTQGYAMERLEGVCPDKSSPYPSPVSFLRRLEKEVPEPAIYLARFGPAAYNKKYARFIDRDYTNLKAGHCWVSDHRQLDQATLIKLPDNPDQNVKAYLKYFENDNRKTSKPVYPWITGWRDFKTGNWMGHCIHWEDPNADHIFQAFYNAASKYGIPKSLYIDNGKDYRCKDFAGGRRIIKALDKNEETKVRSLTSTLGIVVHFSRPYNAQAKTIERDWKTWKQWMDKQMPGYRGGNHVERPEALEGQIKRGEILDYEEFVKLTEYFVTNILQKYQSWGKTLLGRSREEAFRKEFEGLDMITNESLKMFCMRTTPNALTIGRNGIVINQRYRLYYFAEWMSGMKGRKVYLRRDINKYQEAWVFDANTDEYINKADFRAMEAEALAETPNTKAQLASLIKGQQQEKKTMTSYLPTEKPEASKIMKCMADGICATSNPIDSEEIKSNIIRMTQMDEVIAVDKEMQKTGTHDMSFLVPNKEDENPKDNIILFPTDRKYKNKKDSYTK